MNQQPNRFIEILPVLAGVVVGFVLIILTGRLRPASPRGDEDGAPTDPNARARATVISTWPTGQVLMGEAVLRLLLEVRRGGHAPFRTEIECPVAHGRIAQVHAGATLPVRLDSANGERVRIEWT